MWGDRGPYPAPRERKNMRERCATCGAGASEGKTIQAFTELGFGPRSEGGRLHLCTDCLERRKAKRWDPGRQMTSRILSVLEGNQIQHPQGRYSYLRDPDKGVHLVRLHNEWALSHAEKGPSPSEEPEPSDHA